MIFKIAAEFFEPEKTQRGENPAFVGNAVGHHDVVSADAVGGDDQERIAQVINVANLAAANGQRERALEESFFHGGLS